MTVAYQTLIDKEKREVYDQYLERHVQMAKAWADKRREADQAAKEEIRRKRQERERKEAEKRRAQDQFDFDQWSFANRSQKQTGRSKVDGDQNMEGLGQNDIKVVFEMTETESLLSSEKDLKSVQFERKEKCHACKGTRE